MDQQQQLTLFDDDEILKPERKKRNGGSQSSIVFHDYESFVAKFQDIPKTTDDCFTPPDVYEAVVKYVGTVTDLTGRQILRPFFPGGDYENAEYPEDGVVIDNPPFSIFTKVVAFYSAHKIPFFLFGPGLTIASCCKYCTAVIVSEQITFENGAKVKCNFASNLYGDLIITTACMLDSLLRECPSQNVKANLPIYAYPDELLSVSAMQTIAKGGEDFAVRRCECEVVRDLDCHPNKGLFGDHFLLPVTLGAAKEAARKRAQEAAQEAARKAIKIKLSPREQRIVNRLGEACQASGRRGLDDTTVGDHLS